MGLFTGMSVLSVFEIVFFFLRSCCHAVKRRIPASNKVKTIKV